MNSLENMFKVDNGGKAYTDYGTVLLVSSVTDNNCIYVGTDYQVYKRDCDGNGYRLEIDCYDTMDRTYGVIAGGTILKSHTNIDPL